MTIGNRKLWDIIDQTNPDGNLLYVTVTVYTWYGGNSSRFFTISTSNSIIPFVSITGPSVFRMDDTITGGSENSYVTLYGDFIFTSMNESCLLKHNHSLNDYRIVWTARETSNTIDTSELNNYLSTLDENSETISFSMHKYLVPGYEYEISLMFELYLVNQLTNYTATHSIYYDTSDIVCQIAGGDNRIISNVSASTLNEFTVFLDGNTFTYDPDSLIPITNQFDKNNLIFNWNCIKTITYHTSTNTSTKTKTNNCTDQLEMQTSDNSQQLLPLAIDTNKTDLTNNVISIQYAITLSVSRSNADGRNSTAHGHDCQTQTLITMMNPYLETEDGTEISVPTTRITKLLDVSVTAVNAMHGTINYNERLRLLVTINNLDVDDSVIYGSYNHEWIEVNGHLTSQNISQLRINDDIDNSFNLILESNCLNPDETYTFKIIVMKHDASNYHYGEASVEIYVKNDAPRIVDGSFTIEPSCDNIVVDNLGDLLDMSFSITIDANSNPNSNDLILYYQFTYLMNSSSKYSNNFYNYLLHPSLTTNSFLDDVILPIGQFTLQAAVYNSDSSVSASNQNIECNIILNTNNSYLDDQDCLNLSNVVYQHLIMTDVKIHDNQTPLILSNRKYVYLLQTIQVALEYLDQTSPVSLDKPHLNETCWMMLFNEVLDVTNIYFGNANLCQTSYVTVCDCARAISMCILI